MNNDNKITTININKKLHQEAIIELRKRNKTFSGFIKEKLLELLEQKQK